MRPVKIFPFLFALLFCANKLSAQDLLTRQAPLPCLDKTFSVVVHFVRDSFWNVQVTEQMVAEALDAAGPAFDPICVDFEICEFRYIDNFQYRILQKNNWREMQIKHGLPKRLNLYVIAIGGEPCGFSEVASVAIPSFSGVAISTRCVEQGDTKGFVHQLGHYFGLLHTYAGNQTELVDGSNCATAGDLVCDTPADPYEPGDLMDVYLDSLHLCRFIYEGMDANGHWYDPDLGNYMSNFPNNCKCGFTHGQYRRMAETYLGAVGIW